MTPPMRGPFIVRQEPDRLERRKLVVVTVTSIAIAALATASAWLLLVGASPPPVATEKPPPFAPAQIGTVETTLIATTERGLTLRAEQKEALTHYGWVDQDAGIGRIPIDIAIDIVAEHPVPADKAIAP